MQFSRTELYGLSSKYKNRGVERELFPVYVAQVGYGFGLQGFTGQGFIRYGFHPDNDANIISLGFQWDFNLVQLGKIRNLASEL